MKNTLCLLFVFCVLTEIMTVNVLAGEWQREPAGWKWQYDDGSYPKNTWEWLDGNGDRVYEHYFFNQEGYMMTEVYVADGSFINEHGARVVNGEVETRRVAEDFIDQSRVADFIVVLINQERKGFGVSELALDHELASDGQVRAKEMKHVFDHTRPNGMPFYSALTVNYIQAGENIIYTEILDQITEEELAQLFVRCWLNSEVHRKNILAPAWERTAISIYIDENIVYAVQLFVK